METYIGTKIVLAQPKFKGDQDGYEVVYEDGYVSWSPKMTFERAYRRITSAEMRMIPTEVVSGPGSLGGGPSA